MAKSNTVTLSFAGDTKDLDRSFAHLEEGAKDVGQTFDRTSDRIDNLGDSLGDSTGKFRGGKDVLDGFSDSMESLGVSLPGPIGNIAMMAGGVADMADGLGTLLAPALTKARTVMMSLNATIAANPIGVAVIAVAALTAGFIIAYKKSETFRNVVHKALGGVKAAVGFLGDAFNRLWQTVDSVLGKVFDKIVWLWEHSPLGLIVSNLDKIGGFAGKVGGALGKLSPFAAGGQFGGASPILVGERGPEILIPQGPGTIIPNGRLGGGGETRVVVEFAASGDPIFEALKKQIRIRSGGNVQAALGRA